jgi:hypothetical protein
MFYSVTIAAKLCIGIKAYSISVRCRNIPVPDWLPLFWYRTGSGIGILVHSRADWTDAGQSGIPAFVKHFAKVKKGMQTLHVHTQAMD